MGLKTILQTIKILSLVLVCSLASSAQTSVGLEKIEVCPYTQHARASSEQCEKYPHIHFVNPQKREIWLYAELTVPDELLQGDKPLGLFLYGKAATRIYLNDEFLGSNGQPGPNKETETPGQMYSVTYIPTKRITKGKNKLALHMSSHHGWWNLKTPIHAAVVETYADPTSLNLENYWPTLLPLGILLLGAIYMGFLTISRRDHWSISLLPMMSLIAAIQLFAETYRAFSAYLYPVHDIRLAVILVCSTLFGIALFAHVIWTLGVNHKIRTFALSVMITLSGVIMLDGFDTKSTAGFLIPTLLGLALSVYKAANNQPHARPLAITLLVFLSAILLFPWQFLDVTFFYILAGLLIILFINEAQAALDEHKVRLLEQSRADKLQAILDQKQEHDKSGSIKVGSAGKIELVQLSDIVYCKGAGDYVELVLKGHRSILHSDRISELEKTLPSVFLKVHRSYIVNTSLILTLERKQSGVGELALKENHRVPVSRRIMPSVRNRLA